MSMPIFKFAELALLPVVFLWLAVCVRHDLKSREVPVGWTVIPLAITGLMAVLSGRWGPACLVLILVFLSDLSARRMIWGLLATVGVLLAQPTAGALSISIFLVWALWERSLLGGADAKILMALILLWGDSSLLLPVALAGGIQGLLAVWKKQRDIPYTVAITLGTTGFWLTKFI